MFGYASLAAMMGISAVSESLADFYLLPEPSAGQKKSVGDRAWRAYRKTKMYAPNGDRERARRLRQLSA